MQQFDEASKCAISTTMLDNLKINVHSGQHRWVGGATHLWGVQDLEEARPILLRHTLLARPYLAQSHSWVDARSQYVSESSFITMSPSFSWRPFNSDWTVQRLLIGTHTSNDEQNYVQIIKVKIPLESSKDTREYSEGLDDPDQRSGTSIRPGA